MLMKDWPKYWALKLDWDDWFITQIMRLVFWLLNFHQIVFDLMTNLISIKDTDDFLRTSIFSNCYKYLYVNGQFTFSITYVIFAYMFFIFSLSHLQMNTFNHYKRSLYGLDIHYIKVPAKQGQLDELTLCLAGKKCTQFYYHRTTVIIGLCHCNLSLCFLQFFCNWQSLSLHSNIWRFQSGISYPKCCVRLTKNKIPSSSPNSGQLLAVDSY